MGKLICLHCLPIVILVHSLFYAFSFNPVALRMAKTPFSFGRSECNRVNIQDSYCCSKDGLVNIRGALVVQQVKLRPADLMV